MNRSNLSNPKNPNSDKQRNIALFIYLSSIVHYPYILLVIKELLRPTHFLCKDFLISIFYITFSKLTPIVFEISKPVVVIASFLSFSKCKYRYTIHCAEIGSKSTNVSKFSVRRNWVRHIVGTPQGISKHVLEFS